jgi:hypothetical protein
LRLHPVFHLLSKMGRICASVLNTTSSRGKKSDELNRRYRYFNVSA